jgi:tripartite-type tricarboxylate transporter receptor subunit TctC
MSAERLPIFPDLPTAAETVPGLTVVGWQALVAPRGTPEMIVQQLREDLRKALEHPHIQARFEQIGTPFQPMPTAEFVRFIEADQKLWWPIVRGAASK